MTRRRPARSSAPPAPPVEIDRPREDERPLLERSDVPILAGAFALGIVTVALVRWWRRDAASGASGEPFREDIVQTSSATGYAALKDEYVDLYDSLQVRPERLAAVDQQVRKIEANKARYEAVGRPLGIPWYFIGAVHSLESGLRFNAHLHNGDPLTARTVQIPRNRPITGEPPFTWEESATDALRLKSLQAWTDWSVPGLLWQLERYNGTGYRPHRVPTPYLWSGSNHYAKGKFVSDGHYDPEAVSSQIGAAVLLKRMEALGVIPGIAR